jgi:predicted Zn-ribbon and HTH transcriptional regulator
MFRKQLIDLLLDKPMTLARIALEVHQSHQDTEVDLEHLFRSLKHTGYQAVIQPAHCRKCGFQFNPGKLHKPSKCPECHGTWIFEPLIKIKALKPPFLPDPAKEPAGAAVGTPAAE